MKKSENYGRGRDKFRPKKSFGQNFLKNPRVIQKIIDTAGLTGSELVVEVGPGFGILTEALTARARHVIAIEKDNYLFTHLKEKFKNTKNLELIHGDALKIPPPKSPYFLVANIPYSITSPLLDHFIRENPNGISGLPTRAVLLVQKEVAQKICAQPPHMNVLALHVQTFGKPKIIATVSRHNFKPTPKVDSAIIKIEFNVIAQQAVIAIPTLRRGKQSGLDYAKYFNLIHRGFSQKRKMLRALLPLELLKKAGIDPTRRAETLTIDEWQKLSPNTDSPPIS